MKKKKEKEQKKGKDRERRNWRGNRLKAKGVFCPEQVIFYASY